MTTDVLTCERKWNKIFLKLNLSSEKFSKRSFFWKREMFFSKKGLYVLEEYLKKPRLWNI